MQMESETFHGTNLSGLLVFKLYLFMVMIMSMRVLSLTFHLIKSSVFFLLLLLSHSYPLMLWQPIVPVLFMMTITAAAVRRTVRGVQGVRFIEDAAN